MDHQGAEPPPPRDDDDSAVAVLSIDVGRKNLGMCSVRPGACPLGRQDRIAQWIVTTCEPTAAGIAASLKLLPWATECAEVVIERQPNRNPTMTRLQHYLEMYFVLCGKPVTVQDAKHKLAFAAATPWWPGQCDNWTYHTRKKLSVQTTRAFLAQSDQAPQFSRLFESTSKKDDLADALLQGMAFCHNVRPLELSKRLAAAGRSTSSSSSSACVIKPRKPTEKQLASGKFSKPNIVHLLKRCRTLASVKAAAAKSLPLATSIERQFGGVDSPDLAACLRL